MKKRKTYYMVLTALISAIILVLSLVPNLGYITIIPGVSITIVHIPVIVGIFLLPLVESVFLGLVFGASSLLVALIYATNPLDQAFIMPWISILPRMLFAFVAKYVIAMFSKIKHFKLNKIFYYSIVLLITSFSLYFGVHALSKNIKMSKYIVAASEYQEAIEKEKPQTIIDDLEVQMNLELDKFNEEYPKTKQTMTIVIIVLIVVVALIYYYLIIRREAKQAYIPSAILLVTFIHSILVVGALAIFNPTTLKDALGHDNTLFSIILLIALSNGLIEAITASLIGTPIVVAVLERAEEE